MVQYVFEVGERVYLVSKVIGRAGVKHPARIFGREEGWLLYEFDNRFIELRATSGAPIVNERGEVAISGRLDAAQAPGAQEFLDGVSGPCVVDLSALDYISSAGLGVLLRTHKRLMAQERGLELINVNSHINDIFSYSGFDKLFVIRTA